MRFLKMSTILRFLKMSTFLHTKFVVEINLAVRQLVRVTEKGEEVLKLRGRTRITVAFKDV